MNKTLEKLGVFLHNLDTADVERLTDAAVTAFNENVPDAPGPDSITRPPIEKAIKKAIADLCKGV